MRLFQFGRAGLLSLVAVVAVIALVAGACSAEQTTTEFPLRTEFEAGIIEVRPGEAPETQAEDPVDEPADAGAEGEPVADVAGSDAAGSDEADQAGGDSMEENAVVGDGLFPTVVGATASTTNGANWRVDVTLSSTYDSPDRYADAWRVLDADDNELGIRVLGHDHANEQPFTRSTSVDIPTDIDVVFIEGRDQLNGWSGERFELTLTR